MAKNVYNKWNGKNSLAYDSVDYPLAFGTHTTPESGSAMLALAIMAQATKEGDDEFILDRTVNFRYLSWFGIKNLGHLFKGAKCHNE